MKKYLEYIKEEKTYKSLEEKWLDTSFCDQNYEEVKSMIDQGVNINTQSEKYGRTALMVNKSEKIAKLLLSRPEIDVNIRSFDYNSTALIQIASYIGSNNLSEYNKRLLRIIKMILKNPNVDCTLDSTYHKNFIDFLIIRNQENWKSYLNDYDLQKEMIKNNENNILFFDKYNLVHPRIKKEYPLVFAAKSWGLIGESVSLDLLPQWNNAIGNNFDSINKINYSKLQELIDKGFDVNFEYPGQGGNNSLIFAASSHLEKFNKMFDFLLSQPNIDINHKNIYDKTPLIYAAGSFIDKLKKLLERPEIDISGGNASFIYLIEHNIDELRDYDFQQKIVNNGRVDILKYLDKHNLLNPKIKEENPDLFKAANWGLI